MNNATSARMTMTVKAYDSNPDTAINIVRQT